ncbi:solute carrier family 25 (mitochondrial carrier protein), member 16 [Angomonas deanei]|nr:solute carrier family 25 (mitochondrial carrier protein), member 16 [Angomonas deanei]|eukprot:EPY42468.1 solute carrier family 25 (mitochondrial carrier protein), member 16 [Angomonas deanei]
MSSEVRHAPWVDVVAGGTGGVLAKSLLSPFQRIVVLQQLGQHREYNSILKLFRYIYQKEGITGFWKGNLTSMIIRVPYSGIQFLLYTQVKFLLQDSLLAKHKDPQQLENKNELFEKFVLKCGAGGISATIAGAAVYPGEVVRLRLMSGEERYKKIIPTIGLIYKETHSLKNFYRGLGASLMQKVPDILVSFATYESIKYFLLDNPTVTASFTSFYQTYVHHDADPKKMHQVQNILSTIVGGSCAALASIAVAFPLDIAKRRIGMSGSGKDKVVYTGVRHCLQDIYRKEGFRGWYAGSRMEAIRCVPQVVLMWFMIEGIQNYLTKHFCEEDKKGNAIRVYFFFLF